MEKIKRKSKQAACVLLTGLFCLSMGEINFEFNKTGSIRDMVKSFRFDAGLLEAQAAGDEEIVSTFNIETMNESIEDTYTGYYEITDEEPEEVIVRNYKILWYPKHKRLEFQPAEDDPNLRYIQDTDWKEHTDVEELIFNGKWCLPAILWYGFNTTHNQSLRVIDTPNLGFSYNNTLDALFVYDNYSEYVDPKKITLDSFPEDIEYIDLRNITGPNYIWFSNGNTHKNQTVVGFWDSDKVFRNLNTLKLNRCYYHYYYEPWIYTIPFRSADYDFRGNMPNLKNLQVQLKGVSREYDFSWLDSLTLLGDYDEYGSTYDHSTTRYNYPKITGLPTDFHFYENEYYTQRLCFTGLLNDALLSALESENYKVDYLFEEAIADKVVVNGTSTYQQKKANLGNIKQFRTLTYSRPFIKFAGRVGTLYWLNEETIDSDMLVTNIPEGTRIVCIKDSTTCKWLDDFGIEHLHTEDNIPEITMDIIIEGQYTYDFNNPSDIDISIINMDNVSVNIPVLKNEDDLVSNSEYSYTNNNLIISKDYLNTLKDGSYTFTTFDSEDAEYGKFTITINNSTVGKFKPILSGDSKKTFYSNEQKDIIYSITVDEYTDITDITLDKEVIGTSNYTYDKESGLLTLKKSYLGGLDDGTYSFEVVLNDMWGTKIELNITKELLRGPSMEKQDLIFDYNDERDATYSIDFGNKEIESHIKSILLNTKSIPLEKVIIGKDYFDISFGYLKLIENGEYALKVVLDTGEVFSGSTLLVVNNKDNQYEELPSISKEERLFNAKAPRDIVFNASLGIKPSGADGISEVIINNESLSVEDYNFDAEAETLTLNQSYLEKLSNGSYAVGIEFDNGVFKSGATLTVINSEIDSNIDNEEPPEALVTIKYEFYKDYPDHVIVPIKLNGASNITKFKIGTEVVDEEYYELQEGAILINSDYLSTLEAGKYRVLPTFDDKANTTISNIQLIVYEVAADRAAPYLLQSRVIFTGQDFTMTYDEGKGDLRADNVLALVIDDSLVLPNGNVLPFKQSNVTKVQKAYALSMEEETDTKVSLDKEEKESIKIATDSNAEREEKIETEIVEESSTTKETVEESTETETTEIVEENIIEETTIKESTEASVEDNTEESVEVFIENTESSETEEESAESSEESIEETIESNTEVSTEDIVEMSIETLESVEEQVDSVKALAKVYENYDNLVFSVSGNEITVNGEFIETLSLSEGDHLVGAIFDNTEKTTDVKKVILTIPGSGEDEESKAPSFEKADKEYDKKSPSDLTWTYDLGTGDKGASKIVSVTIDGVEVEFKVIGGTLIISSEDLSGLDLGSHKVEVKFNDTEETTITGMTITVKDSSSSEDNKPSGGDNTGDNTGDNKPSGGDNTGDNTGDNKPSGGDNTGNNTEDNKPSGGGNTDKPYRPGNTGGSTSGGSTTRPSGGSSGGSSGGGSTSRPASTGSDINHGPGVGTVIITDGEPILSGAPIHTDGSYNSQYKPGAVETGGSWYGSGDKWSYMKPDGTMARSEWVGHEGESYYINAEGLMETGWYLDTDGKWYMLNTDHNGKFGAALIGWYYEKADGKWYFMNPQSKEMLIGWQFIDSKNYYFTEVNEGQTYFGDNIKGWVYDTTKGRPYGSMYVNETTPDGKQVDTNGARVN